MWCIGIAGLEARVLRERPTKSSREGKKGDRGSQAACEKRKRAGAQPLTAISRLFATAVPSLGARCGGRAGGLLTWGARRLPHPFIRGAAPRRTIAERPRRGAPSYILHFIFSAPERCLPGGKRRERQRRRLWLASWLPPTTMPSISSHFFSPISSPSQTTRPPICPGHGQQMAHGSGPPPRSWRGMAAPAPTASF